MSGEDSNSHTRLEIGKTLERTRKERGLSLEAVEEATKIRVRYLRALENENFDVLPAVYMLGSLKTYARHLGLDEAALTGEFKHRQALLQEVQDREEPHADEPRGLFASLSRLLGAESHEAGEDEEGTASDRVHSPRLYLSLGVVLIFVFVIALASTLRAEDQPAVSQVHETRISKFPSMIALAGNLGEERNTEENKGNQARSPAKDASKDQKAEHSEQGRDAPQMAQASTSSATASASASASTSSGSTASATAKSASVRPKQVPTEESDSAGRGVAADASAGPSARARAGPVVQRKQAGPIDATRLSNRITNRAWSIVDGAW